MDNPDAHVGGRVSTVLVVEDDPLVRIAAVEYLQNSGFSVLEATPGDDARVLIRQSPEISIVFSDVQMPGSMDGVALARWLASECPRVAVLLTSGRAVPDRSGSWRFLPKPYNFAELDAS
jgi:CheY-like chemotaxis protein